MGAGAGGIAGHVPFVIEGSVTVRPDNKLDGGHPGEDRNPRVRHRSCRTVVRAGHQGVVRTRRKGTGVGTQEQERAGIAYERIIDVVSLGRPSAPTAKQTDLLDVITRRFARDVQDIGRGVVVVRGRVVVIGTVTHPRPNAAGYLRRLARDAGHARFQQVAADDTDRSRIITIWLFLLLADDERRVGGACHGQRRGEAGEDAAEWLWWRQDVGVVMAGVVWRRGAGEAGAGLEGCEA